MDIMESWSVFERTGSIGAYLMYTACTREEAGKEYKYNGDENNGSSTGDTSWNGVVGNAGGGN